MLLYGPTKLKFTCFCIEFQIKHICVLWTGKVNYKISGTRRNLKTVLPFLFIILMQVHIIRIPVSFGHQSLKKKATLWFICCSLKQKINLIGTRGMFNYN
jgi:hypothetical protein